MPVAAGSCWVEGQYLHFCPTTTTEYRYLGFFVANRSAATSGSLWIDGAYVRYIDSNKDERYLPLGTASSPAGVSSAINGSVWIENNRINAVEGTTKQKREYHTDVAAHVDNYFSNTPFGNFAFVNHYDIYDIPSFYNSAPYSDGPFDNVSFNNTPHDDQPEYVGTV